MSSSETNVSIKKTFFLFFFKIDFLSALNEKFKSFQIHNESEKEILNILSNISLQCSGIFRNLTESISMLIQVFDSRIIKMKQKIALSQSQQNCEDWKQEIESLKSAHSKV